MLFAFVPDSRCPRQKRWTSTSNDLRATENTRTSAVGLWLWVTLTIFTVYMLYADSRRIWAFHIHLVSWEVTLRSGASAAFLLFSYLPPRAHRKS